MNIYTYEFRVIPSNGSDPGRWELHLMHNGQLVGIVNYQSGDSVDEAVKRGQEWVAEMERNAPLS